MAWLTSQKNTPISGKTNKMGFGVGMILQGDKELNNVFNALKSSHKSAAVRKAAEWAMIPVRKGMKQNIKKLEMDSKARTEYAKSIGVKTKTYASTGTVVVVVGPENKKFDTGRNWANLSHLFELGTSPHEITAKSGKRLSFIWKGSLFRLRRAEVEGIKPQPHVYPALSDRKDEVKRRFATRFRERIYVLAAKAAAKAGKK